MVPFNSAIVGLGGRRVFILAKLDAEDLATLYVVDTQLEAQFPSLVPALPGDLVQLTLGGFTFVAALADNFCIDAIGLDDEVEFELTLEAGCFIRGRGGEGGDGGNGEDGPSDPDDGEPGLIGGTAIRLGCPTNILGIGTIERGYGGGGGGAGNDTGGEGDGGSGGGGGAPLGIGGREGRRDSGTPGDPGETATVLLGGAGGTRHRNGGDGGSEGIPAEAGSGKTSPPPVGGAPGADGDAIDSQGFTVIQGPSIIVEGPII